MNGGTSKPYDQWGSIELKNQTILWTSRTHRIDSVLLNNPTLDGGAYQADQSSFPDIHNTAEGLRIEYLNGSVMIIGSQLSTL